MHAGRILRYDGATGAPLPSAGNTGAVFVTAAAGGLDAPQGMVFGPDGNLYVASGNFFTGINGPAYKGDDPPGAVLKFEGPSGASPAPSSGRSSRAVPAAWPTRRACCSGRRETCTCPVASSPATTSRPTLKPAWCSATTGRRGPS